MGDKKGSDAATKKTGVQFADNKDDKPCPRLVVYDNEYFTKPDFIYEGPFVTSRRPNDFIDAATPMNAQLQGTFKQGLAYDSLTNRLPIIMTKVIDKLSQSGGQAAVKEISKIKNDLMTNKHYELFEHDSPDCKEWNKAIRNCDNTRYYNNIWVFTECYVYRKMWEACQRSNLDIDYFADVKRKAFEDSLETACQVADRLSDMLPLTEDKAERKLNFSTLLKISMWANKLDYSHSLCEPMTMKSAINNMKPFAWPKKKKAKPKKGAPLEPVEPPPKPSVIMDPLQMLLDLKDRVLADDSGKVVDQMANKADKIRKAIENYTPPPRPGLNKKGKPIKVKPPPLPPPEIDEEGNEIPRVPCPAKLNIPSHVFFDIVPDNCGFELFCDICIGHFMISQQIAQKIRFHLKKYPWYVSGVTPKDFNALIESCKNASFSRSQPAETNEEGEVTKEEITVGADKVRELGQKWADYLADGTFILMADDIWVSPYLYKDMKRVDYLRYRKLQMACGILFKGDLNYRKLLGEKKCSPYTKFPEALQLFWPCPVITARTVKSDLICGMKKGKYEILNEVDPKWMELGNFGVINFSNKTEKITISPRPCLDYGDQCKGVYNECPKHSDI